MTQPEACTACLHPRRAEIDEGVRKGWRLTRISGLIGGEVSAKSISRHRDAGHVLPDRKDPGTPPPVAPLGDGASEIEVLEQILRERAAADTRTMSPAQRVQHDEVVRKTAESLSRMRPPVDREGPAQEELRELRLRVREILVVLDRHPEVRAEVADAFAELRKRVPR